MYRVFTAWSDSAAAGAALIVVCTTYIPRLKAYIFFRKSNEVKLDQNFRKIYEKI
jgi:hypothetical protein